MDLIGGVKYLENRFGGRRPNHGKEQPAKKTTRKDAADETKAVADRSATEFDTQLGRKVDTTA